MFGKKEMPSQTKSFHAHITKSVAVEGTFTSEDDVVFAGKMKGNMKVHGTLNIQEGAEVVGDIEAINLVISGKVEGNCTTTENLQIEDGGIVNGDVYVGDQFVLSPGGTFLGSSKMVEKADIEVEDIKDDLDLDDLDLDDL